MVVLGHLFTCVGRVAAGLAGQDERQLIGLLGDTSALLGLMVVMVLEVFSFLVGGFDAAAT